MIEYNYMSRNMKDPNKYREMYHTRLEYKAKKDKRANVYKLALNSVYGCLKDKHNALYDPLMSNNVCITGQLMLLDLIEHAEPYVEIVTTNTDGVLFKLIGKTQAELDYSFNNLDRVCREWEARTRMNLEFDFYKEVYQRDVNNYLLIDHDGNAKGKGGLLKKLNTLDYDLPIINKALKAYMINKTPIEETVYACNNLIEFQKIYKLSNKYLYAYHNHARLNDTVFRVFASLRESDTALHKIKNKGDTEEITMALFADCPKHCFIDNSNVQDKPIPYILDRQWYIDKAKQRLVPFGVKLKKKVKPLE